MKNILEYLEATAFAYPNKIAAKDDKSQCTYTELLNKSREIGTTLSEHDCVGKPILVYMDKSVETLQIFMGVVQAGGFYVLGDPSFPVERLTQILEVLEPACVITKEEHREKLLLAGYGGIVVMHNQLGGDFRSSKLEEIRNQVQDIDPLYGIFTSGSTGLPKCVLIGHRSVIDFIDHFTETFAISEHDIIGNQAPFDFDVSVKDIYSCLKTGATLVIIPKSFFMFPTAVIDMLEENHVTTLIWAVSALCLLNRLHGLKYKRPDSICKIMFSGEQMPVKQLNQWKAYYPDAMFVNLYGPTEITCNCTYYIVDREFEEDEILPIGKPFPNEKVMLIDNQGKEVTTPGEKGELCVAGTTLGIGYYNNWEVTSSVFTQNPLNTKYPERIYHTGDLAHYGADGKLYFAGRKDFQIKHMGHRIELEEIDAVLNSLEHVERACCFFDENKNKIVAYFSGETEKKEIVQQMRRKIPDYMIPNVFLKLDTLPITKNGKIDRGGLKSSYQCGGNHDTN